MFQAVSDERTQVKEVRERTQFCQQREHGHEQQAVLRAADPLESQSALWKAEKLADERLISEDYAAAGSGHRVLELYEAVVPEG